MKREEMKKQMIRRAFTLLEVLIVIVIIGILAAVVATNLSGTSERAQKDLTRTMIEGTLVPKLEMFKLHCQRYPTSDEGLIVLLEQPDDEEIAERWAGPYIKAKQLKDAWGNEFIYEFPGEYNPERFDISSPGPNRVPGDEDDIGNWTQTE